MAPRVYKSNIVRETQQLVIVRSAPIQLPSATMCLPNPPTPCCHMLPCKSHAAGYSPDLKKHARSEIRMISEKILQLLNTLKPDGFLDSPSESVATAVYSTPPQLPTMTMNQQTLTKKHEYRNRRTSAIAMLPVQS